MFWRFGSLELSRPVAATPWLNEAWTRPSSGATSVGQGVEVGALELGELAVLDQEPRAAGACAASSSRTSCVGARLAPGRLLGATGASARRRGPGGAAGREPMLNGRPGLLVDLRPRSPPAARRTRAESWPQPRDVDLDARPPPSAPGRAISGPFEVGVEVPEPLARGPWGRGSPRSARWRRRPRRRTRRPWRRRPGPSVIWFFPLPIRSVIGIIAWSSSRCESWSRLWFRSPLSSR